MHRRTVQQDEPGQSQRGDLLHQSGSCGGIFYGKAQTQGYRMCVSVNMALISPREIFLEALKDKAVSLILVHNHPSGDPTPSRSDRELTENVAKVGNQMDIPLLDHIIIGDNRYTSFREQKFLI